mgnify:CR=1 FL=1
MRRILIRCCFIVALLSGCAEQVADVAVGTLERERIEVVASQAEPIVEMFVVDGDSVVAGQPLLQLDDRSSDADLSALLAAKEQAAARLAELERGPRQELITQASALVLGNRSQVVDTKRSLERLTTLRRQGLASQADVDQAQAGVDSATSHLAATDAQLQALLHGTTAEELHQAREWLAQAAARIIPARIRKDKLLIRAPVDGVVDDILYKTGEQPGIQQVVLVILADRRVFARVYIPQSHRTQLSVGQQLTLTAEGVEGFLTGRIKKISRDPAFTPYYALTERNRSRLSYLAEIDLDTQQVAKLPVGLPLQVQLNPVMD